MPRSLIKSIILLFQFVLNTSIYLTCSLAAAWHTKPILHRKKATVGQVHLTQLSVRTATYSMLYSNPPPAIAGNCLSQGRYTVASYCNPTIIIIQL